MAEASQTDLKDQIEKAKLELTQLRDDIRVRVNLAGMEVRDEWNKIEERIFEWEENAKRDLSPIANEISERFSKLKADVSAFKDRITGSGSSGKTPS